MRGFLLFLCLIAFSTCIALSQHTPRGFIDYQRNSPNCPISFGVTNTGIIGCDTVATDPGLEFPRGSGNTYLYNSGIAYGSYSTPWDTIPHLFAVTSYNDFTGKSWMTPFHTPSTKDDIEYAKVYFSTDFDAQGHPKNGKGYNYPVWKTVSDKNGGWVNNPNERIPSDLRLQVAVHSHEDIICKFDDRDSTKYIYPWFQSMASMGMITEMHTYSFFSGPLQNAIIVRCRIINNSDSTYVGFVAGPVLDPDIGKVSSNDYGKYYIKDATLNLLYGWSGSDSSRLGYIGVGFLEVPLYDSVSRELATSGSSTIRPVPINGYSVSKGIQNDTLNTFKLYKALTIKSKDSVYNGDIRFKMSAGDVLFHPLDTFEFAYAIVLAMPTAKNQADGSEKDVEGLVQLFRQCKAVYKVFSETGVLTEARDENFNESSDILAYPSPADSRLFIESKDGKSFETAEIYDASGRLCATQSLDAVHPLLSVSTLPNGVYRIVLKSTVGMSSFLHPVIH